MRKTTLNPRKIYQIARSFSRVNARSRRGRPRTYNEALIMTIAAMQNLYDLSFREALEFCEDFLKSVPTLATYHYRVQTLPLAVVEQFIAFLGSRLEQAFTMTGKPLKLFIIDTTGFSFQDVYPLQYHRGTEVRKVQAHVRAFALVASTGKERFVIGAKSGSAYASETKLVGELLPQYSFKKPLPFLGDKIFDAISLLTLIKQHGALPAIQIKQTNRHTIRSSERLESAYQAERYGRKRTLIEGLFGNTKQKTTSHIKVFSQHIARLFALLRLALYDLYLLVRFQIPTFVLLIFRTPSFEFDKVT